MFGSNNTGARFNQLYLNVWDNQEVKKDVFFSIAEFNMHAAYGRSVNMSLPICH